VLEPWKLSLEKFDFTFEFLQSSGNDSLILDWIKRASRVGNLTANFQNLDTFPQNSELQWVQGL
jgi:hypothetical protein